jgi:hypothetical protein
LRRANALVPDAPAADRRARSARESRRSRRTDVEDVTQEKGGALLGREPLEHKEEGDREIVAPLETPIGWRAAVEVARPRLRQPGADIGAAFGRRFAQAIDRKPRRRGHQPRLGRPDRRGIGLVPAQERLLHNVLGIAEGAEHPIGDTAQTRPMLHEKTGLPLILALAALRRPRIHGPPPNCFYPTIATG